MSQVYYRVHPAEQTEAEFIAGATTWVWDDLGAGMVAVAIPGVYSALESVERLRGYITSMMANDTDDVIAVFEGDEETEVVVNGISYSPYEPEDGEIWVQPIRLLRFAKPSEFCHDAEVGK